MNTEKPHNAIIRKILEIKDPVLLDNKEKSLIKESLADFETGNTIANRDVMNRFDKWLDRRIK